MLNYKIIQAQQMLLIKIQTLFINIFIFLRF